MSWDEDRKENEEKAEEKRRSAVVHFSLFTKSHMQLAEYTELETQWK